MGGSGGLVDGVVVWDAIAKHKVGDIAALISVLSICYGIGHTARALPLPGVEPEGPDCATWDVCHSVSCGGRGGACHIPFADQVAQKRPRCWQPCEKVHDQC